MGIDPRNVHAANGQGFEDTLDVVVADHVATPQHPGADTLND